EGRIDEIGFSVKGCAICTASASLLCEQVRGLDRAEAIWLADEFENAVATAVDEPWAPALGGLLAFQHLRVNPARRTCALLPWIALRAAFSAGSSKAQSPF